MICCFTCSVENVVPVVQLMDSAEPEVSSASDILETEKLCKDLCRSIGQSTEKTASEKSQIINQTTNPTIPDSEMEGLLNEISELLAIQSGSTGNSSSSDGLLDSNKSVEEILNEAEKLVSMSLAQLNTSTTQSSLHLKHSNTPMKAPKTNQNTVKFSDVTETISFHDANSSPFKIRSKSDPEITISYKADKTYQKECQKRPNSSPGTSKVTEPKKASEMKLECDNRLLDGQELKLSDLATVYNNSTSIENEESKVVSIRDNICNSVNNNIFQTHAGETFDRDSPIIPINLQSTKDNDFLWSKVDFLNNRVETFKKNEDVTELPENTLPPGGQNRLALLEEEVKSQVELIASYQKENERLCSDIIKAKERWKEIEMKLHEKVRNTEHSKVAAITKANHEIANLKDKLKQADEFIASLQKDLKVLKEEKLEVDKLNEELNAEVTRLSCEVNEYKKEMEDWKKAEKEKILAIETNAKIQGKLSQANTDVTRKQSEIVRLNGLIGQLRGELEKIRLGSIINQSAENLTGTISQLQAALAIERENSKDISKEKESLSKEILDLRRQVKEMENILIKRSKSGSCIQLGDTRISDLSELSDLEKKYKALIGELCQAQSVVASKQKLLNDLQDKYDQDVSKLKLELEKLKKESEERERGQKAVAAAKEDAHLLATIRGLKAEISSRDKDIVKLNRELDDVKKTNKRLQREREKALNSGKYRSGVIAKELPEKTPRVESDQGSSKEYNPSVYEEQEAVIFLRSENKNLKEEIRKLEQDLISLHNKRIQDLSDLQEQHESEITRMVREHAAKHSSSSVSHLQGQLYTQQMVIHHLKEQIKMLEERAGEVTLLKAERDHLENSLIEANKKIARLHELQSPESVQYTELLEKLDFLERRHELIPSA